MKKLLRSKKALSPVIAAIILIAVTVAVSIAVAAWMGSLSMGFMETKELTITDMTFPDAGNITVTVSNPGTTAVTVNRATLNGDSIAMDATTLESGDEGVSVEIPGATWTNGYKYSVSLFATDGTLVASYTETAPA
jgi:flagellin-like protein